MHIYTYLTLCISNWWIEMPGNCVDAFGISNCMKNQWYEGSKATRSPSQLIDDIWSDPSLTQPNRIVKLADGGISIRHTMDHTDTYVLCAWEHIRCKDQYSTLLFDVIAETETVCDMDADTESLCDMDGCDSDINELIICFEISWYNTIWYDMMRYDMIWYDMIIYDMISMTSYMWNDWADMEANMSGYVWQKLGRTTTDLED